MLNNFELILLDNLIYILKNEDKKYYEKSTLENIISDLLRDENQTSDKGKVGYGSGGGGGTSFGDQEENDDQKENGDKKENNDEKDMTKIENCYKNANTGKPQCGIEKEEWINILKAIKNDKKLCNLIIHDVTSEESSGFRAATFTSDTENIIIFKGTTDPVEWMDNGTSGYSIETPLQKRALDYVNSIDLVNNNPFTVSGHSKGGNLAQYVTLFASDLVIDKCLSFNGQGFSNELCETDEYKDALKRNQDKMYMIASSGDYVNILFNYAILDKNKMYVKANPVGISLVA